MKLFLALAGLVAVLKVVLNLLDFITVVQDVTPNLPGELSAFASLALLLGGAWHFARRATVIPPRPLLCVAGTVLVAPLLARGLADPGLYAAWSPAEFLFESALVQFQVVGLWVVGGALFGGPFACPRGHVR